MPLLSTLGDIRDVFIIIYGIMGIIFFVVASIVIFMVGSLVRKLLGNVNGMLDETVKPTVSSIKSAAETVRGTTEFVGQSAVSPIARTYGAIAGVRRGVGVFSALNRRRRG